MQQDIGTPGVCPVPLCQHDRRPGESMCRPHWKRVPGKLKWAINTSVNIVAYTAALTDAISSVAGVRNVT